MTTLLDSMQSRSLALLWLSGFFFGFWLREWVRTWRYCGWVYPGEVTWWHASWWLSDWWDWSEELGCRVDSICILGFCFERPVKK